MKPCPECGSDDLYKCLKPITARGGYGPDLLPDLRTSFFSPATMIAVVCANCGLLRFYASAESRQKVSKVESWSRV